jgi:O-antigen/teichoic acid export membrane protein
VSVSEASRTRRLVEGWSANFVQMLLGLTQQVALVPIFLHYWTHGELAAWFVIYAVGNLVTVADGGLQVRAINRFLAFKSSVDCDGRTARFYGALLRVYLGLAAILATVLLVGAQIFSPAGILGFESIPNFGIAFVVMATGMLLMLPSNLVSALYRARGRYGRVVALQNWSLFAGQCAQLVAIMTSGSVLAVTIAFVAAQLLMAFYFLTIDATRLFPFLRWLRVGHSWYWIIGQFRVAAPFGVAAATELALLNLPVLLISTLVSDRVAVAQWGLTRVVAGVLRSLCIQTTLPLAAELGHDYALGLKDQLRSLYARGSVLVTLQAGVVVSGLLPFWPDFFALWTRGAVPYDSVLAITLLIGSAAVAPSILALSYAHYSNRGGLLAWTKGLQLAVFLVLSVLLIGPFGPLGAAIAVVASDLLIQFGLLGSIIIWQTLQRPLRHLAFLAVLLILVTLGGSVLGEVIRSLLPGTGLTKFLGECALWLIIVLLIASSLAKAGIRARLDVMLPK